VNSSDQHPTFTNIVAVCRTQKSGDKDIMQRNLMTCGAHASRSNTKQGLQLEPKRLLYYFKELIAGLGHERSCRQQYRKAVGVPLGPAER
jgi:hypothetical protein